MRPLICLIRKEFLQLRRDPALLRLVLMVPIIQLLILAHAINNDLRNLRVSVFDDDRTPTSRRIAEALHEADVFKAGPAPAGARRMEELLRAGRTDLAVHVPAGFTRDLLEGRSPGLGIVVDGTNSSIAGRAVGYTLEVLSREALRANLEDGAAGATAEPRFLYNPELESRFYMVPGIIVMLVTIISALATGMAVVREKEIGTLEQVMVTPISSFQFIAGKTLPFALIALFDMMLATIFARFWFHVPLAGSPYLLLLGAIAYLLVTLGLGLLASAVSQTQQQAMFTVWFFLVFGILLSGFFFPVDNMPAWARLLTYLNPMRFFMEIVRGVFLRGSGLADLADELLILLAMGAASFTGAVMLFRRTSA